MVAWKSKSILSIVSMCDCSLKTLRFPFFLEIQHFLISYPKDAFLFFACQHCGALKKRDQFHRLIQSCHQLCWICKCPNKFGSRYWLWFSMGRGWCTRRKYIFFRRWLERNRINKGTSLITFFGHSAATIFDIGIDEPEKFTNVGKYFFFLANGCNSGFIFDINSNGSYSDRFIKLPNKGAIGFLATANFSFDDALIFKIVSLVFWQISPKVFP